MANLKIIERSGDDGAARIGGRLACYFDDWVIEQKESYTELYTHISEVMSLLDCYDDGFVITIVVGERTLRFNNCVRIVNTESDARWILTELPETVS